MSFEITVAQVEQYRANILLLSQQKVSVLRRTCIEGGVVGRSFYADRIGATAGQDITERHGDTPLNSTPHSRRRGTLTDWDIADLLDTTDQLKMIIDPMGTYIQNFVAAANRRMDKHIVTALGGPAYAGQSGGTTINAYDDGECRMVNSDGVVVAEGSNIAAATETALTIGKLATCKQLLDEADIDDERQRHFVTNPYNIVQLLQTTEVKSADYNDVKALKEGKIKEFMGFMFHKLNDYKDAVKGHLTDTPAEAADTVIDCFAWAQGAVTLGVGKDITTSVDKRPGKRLAQQAYMMMSMGAMRNEGPAVIKIALKKKA